MKREKFKNFVKSLNFKKVLRGFVVLVGLGMIVFMTIANIGFNEEFNFLEWFGNVLILVGIGVFFILIGESSGYDRQRDRVVKNDKGEIIGGLFQKTLFELNKFLMDIDPIKLFFDQFYAWYLPRQLFDKKVGFLIENGLDYRKAKKIVEYCTYSDLYRLKNEKIAEYENPNKGNDKAIIRQLEEFEIAPVEEVLKGNIKLDAPAASFYLSPFGKANSDQNVEKGRKTQKDIKTNKKISRAIKISSAVVISIVWALLTVKDFVSGDNAQAWMNLISRLLMALTSYLSGWLSSVTTVRLECEVLMNKLDILKIFKTAYEKHIFTYYGDDELDEKDLADFKEEQEKQKNNVVIAEVVNQNEQPEQIPQQEPKLIEGGK